MDKKANVFTIEAPNINKAFDMLISTLNASGATDIEQLKIGDCVQTHDTYDKNKEKESLKLIERFRCIDGVVDYIDLGEVGYLARSVKKINKEYTAKIETKFVVCNENQKAFKPEEENIFTDKQSAEQKASEYALKGKKSCVRKIVALTEGNDIVSEFETIEKKVNKKSEGKDYTAIHRYLLFGYLE
jgi:tetrahydromethanopterin S-methyltransferase subunit A